MKRTITFATLMLGGVLLAVAQMGSTPNSTPTGTPSTIPQDQTGQTPSTPSSPSAIPSETSASGSTQASNSQPTKLEGCLSQSSDGSFILADNSGTSYQLRGDTTRLNNYLGKQVRVDGMVIPSSGTSAGAMASSSGAHASSAGTQFTVSQIHKVADTCPSSR
jgi:hypothetical protein